MAGMASMQLLHASSTTDVSLGGGCAKRFTLIGCIGTGDDVDGSGFVDSTVRKVDLRQGSG